MNVIFNDKEYKKNGKNRTALKYLCFDIFQKYLDENDNLIYIELKNIFNKWHCNNNFVVLSKVDWKNKTEDLKKRYFDPVNYNSEDIYFTTQWGNNGGNCDNINNMIEFAKAEGYQIKIKNKPPIYIENTTTLHTNNIILYGAPGVGKTHNYQRIISMIENDISQEKIFDVITNNTSPEGVALNDENFQTVKKEKRIEFITFHQSYSYEDFIEGYRPNEDGNIKLEDGVFKFIATKANENKIKSNNTQVVLFKDAINLLLKIKIENQETVQIDLKRKNSFYKIYDYNERTIFFEKQNGNLSHSLSLKTLEKMYMEEKNNIINGGLSPYYNPLLDRLLKIKNETTTQRIEQKNFYIVIDEINRGNISKIFGELITLIEEDKRDVYEVKLPYSKEVFNIPSNLYIIATMNSTDKSIATIDIALRRRFTFLKMKPNLELVKNLVSKNLMKKLNEYIKSKLGEDYMLGHSYFMKVNNESDLNFIKEYKIKPLLEEYFYADEITADEIIKKALES